MRIVRRVGFVLAPLLFVAAAGTARAAAPDLASLALKAGLAGDDASPLFRLDNRANLPPALLERPKDERSDHVQRDPAVRVHVATAALPGREAATDERAEQALQVAVRTLLFCRALGLGGPADDGDHELDVYLAPLHGAARGYAALESPAPPGRGASGFAVVDASARQGDAEFRDMVARVVARLVLAGHDAGAPAFWSEPSALWIAERVTGSSPELDRAVAARWNHPERGPFVDDPLLARGNVALLSSLGDADLAGRALAATWHALATRADADTPAAVIESSLRLVTGLGLPELEARAGIVQVVTGAGPARWAGRVQSLPVLEMTPPVPLAALGVALVHLAPDPHDAEGTRVAVTVAEPGWTATLVARRRGGGWDRTSPSFDAGRQLAVTVPWNDYDEATLFLARPAGLPGDAGFTLRAEAADRAGLYALTSFGARADAGRGVRVSWSTSSEEGLFGWMVERAPSAEGPWEPVLPTPVPSLGVAGSGSDYAVEDASRADRGRVFYRIVVLTAEGLRVTGPAVAARP